MKEVIEVLVMLELAAVGPSVVEELAVRLGIDELTPDVALTILELDPVGPAVMEELAVRLGITKLTLEVVLEMLELEAVGLKVVKLAVELDTNELILEDDEAVGPAELLKFMELEGPIDGVGTGNELVVAVVPFSGSVVFIKTALMAAGLGSGKLIALGVLR